MVVAVASFFSISAIFLSEDIGILSISIKYN